MNNQASPNIYLSRLALCCALALAAACGSPAPPAQQATPVKVDTAWMGLIPVPREVSVDAGRFLVEATTPVTYTGGEGTAGVARFLVDAVKRDRILGLPAPREGAASRGINFILKKDGFAPEGYSLVIGGKGVNVTAASDAGLFYGAVTLWQIMTARTGTDLTIELPAVHINDAPRFGWRGLMLDSARHYQSPEFIKKFIDAMALHKLNVLHWHLTDDQAWRLEIKKYPRLTSVGAWRVPAGAAARADIDEKTGKPRLYGGFYTQTEARDIVAYAAARHITVMPEIEMPGHASAAVVAYPQLGVTNNPPKAVPEEWGVFTTLFNADDATFGFFEDVLGEVMEVFPSKYIHVGGDEAVKDEWQASAKIQARMKELQVADEHALQSYFIQRVGKFINSKGRKLIGWDEILEGGLAPDATVMSWRGIDGAIAAAKAGHDTVLSPAPDLYLDHWQSAGDLSPGRSNTLSLEDVYRFDPEPASIGAEQRKHILGMQANLWAEFMRTDARVMYMAFPRAAAVAEVAWSQPGKIDWADFQRRLAPQLARYDALGIAFGREVKVEPGPRRRVSHDLAQCGDGYLLSLEDDAPISGERAVFLVNISNPCWVWKAADLTKVQSLRAVVGQIPFNFQIGKDAAGIPLPKPKTASGELEIRLDKCDGPVFDRISLETALPNNDLTRLPTLNIGAQKGTHDICFQFTRTKVDPIWVISSIELVGN
ncbi:MAG: beta-N-acetylhexosaminidase [Pseudomonadota bacterium]